MLALFCGLLVASDMAVLRLPDPIMAWAYPAFLVLIAVAAAGVNEWDRFGRAVLAGLALLVFYLVNALVVPSGMSLGDVKFAGLLGAMLGWEGWLNVLWGTLLAATFGGLAGLVLILVRRGGLKTEYAYGPMMAAGAWTAMVWLR
ncbi:MAG: A24 family peptidase [Propionibacterium sp.]|nr:A24 family peptidase [Propionibacterium sp.]